MHLGLNQLAKTIAVPGRMLLFFLICAGPVVAASNQLKVGVCTHYPTDEGLSLLQQAGVNWIRDDLWWHEIEKKRGVYRLPDKISRFLEEANDRDMKPVWILGYNNDLYEGGRWPLHESGREAFARYAEFCLRQMGDRVEAWEVWNEWNWATGFPTDVPKATPQQYVALLKKVYLRLKAIDPHAVILGGAVAGTDIPWLQEACRAGMLKYCDGVSVHPYCYGAPGNGVLPEKGWMNRIDKYRDCLREFNGGKPFPLYVTEAGWPNYQKGSDLVISADETARYLARTILLAATMPDLKGVWWYDLKHDGLDPANREHNFGLLQNDLTPNAAYFALRDVNAFLKQAVFVSEEPKAPADVKILRFRKEGEIVYAVWNSYDQSNWQITWKSSQNLAGRRVRLQRIGHETIDRQWIRDEKKRGSRLTITTGSTPLLIEGDLDSASLYDVQQIR